MTRTRLAWLSSFCAMGLAASVAAACPAGSLTVTQMSGSAYDPSVRIGEVITLRIAPAPGFTDRDCLGDRLVRVALGSANEDHLEQGASELDIRVTPGDGLREIQGGAIVLGPVAVRALRRGRTVTVTLARIQPGQLAPTGLYEQEFRLMMRNVAVAETTLASTVAPAVQLAGPSRTGRQRIFFGEPEEGESVETAIFYRTNASVMARGRSEQGGRMIHELGEEYGYIPYRAQVAGNDLGSDGTINVDLPVTGAGQMSVAAVRFELLEPSPLYAGRYRDIFVLELVAY